MRNRFLSIGWLAIDVLFALSLNSQINLDSINGFYRMNSHYSYSFIDSLRKKGILSIKDTLDLIKVNTDENGNKHIKFKHKREGIEVYGSTLIVHVNKSDSIYLISGVLPKKYATNQNINISYQDAINIGIKNTDSELFMWQDPDYENQLKIQTGDSLATFYPNPELIFFPNENNEYELCYKLLISSVVPYKQEYMIISAIRGTIITTYPATIAHLPSISNKINAFNNKTTKNDPKKKEIQYTHLSVGCSGECVIGSGNTLYYGNQTIYIGRHSFTGDCKYRLFKKCGNTYIHTLSKITVSYNSSSSDGNEYTDQNSTFNYAVLSPGVTIHWGLNECLRFYWDKFGRNGFNDNVGTTINAFSNNNSGGSGNAFYNSADKTLNFGNGDNCSYCYNDIVSLDIIGHEFTHGISDSEVGFYYFGESGALNESFSDIFGNMIEYYAKLVNSTGTSFSYIQGNEVYAHVPIYVGNIVYYPERDMSNPNYSLLPDTYGGTYFINPTNNNFDYGGVHINCAVQDFFFYLLCEGGQGVNDLGNYYCVHGIGKEKATKIAYHTLINYMVPMANFSMARYSFIQSAIDIFGIGSLELAEVQAAWYAVGVGNPPSVPFIVIASKTDYGTHYYNYNNTLLVTDYTAAPGSHIDMSSNDEIWLKADYNPAYYNREVHFSQGSEAHLYIAPACSGGAKLSHQKSKNNVDSLSYESVANLLSSSHSVAQNVNVYPNPASKFITVYLYQPQKTPSIIVIKDISGRVVLQKETSNNIEMIDASDLPEGLYFISIRSENNAYTQKIIVQR